MPPQGCADSDQMPKPPTLTELAVGPDKSTTVSRLVLISQNPWDFAALLKSTQTDEKRIIHFSLAHKSGPESNSREAKGRAQGLGDPPILLRRPLSELCGSAGRMQVGKMQVMLLSVLRVSVRRVHWFIFTWFSIQPLSRGQNKERVIISLKNKLFVSCLLNAGHSARHWGHSNKQIHEVLTFDKLSLGYARCQKLHLCVYT